MLLAEQLFRRLQNSENFLDRIQIHITAGFEREPSEGHDGVQSCMVEHGIEVSGEVPLPWGLRQWMG